MHATVADPCSLNMGRLPNILPTNRHFCAIIGTMVTNAPLGIVDALSAGFVIVNRRLWILLLPILLDIFLLYGPGVSINPLVEDALGLIQAQIGSQSATADAAAPGDNRTALSQTLEQSQLLLASYRDANLLGVLAWQVPSVLTATAHASLPKLAGRPVAEVTNGLTLLTCALGLGVLGLLLASIYLAAIAQALSGDAVVLSALYKSGLLGWLQFTLFFVALLVGTVMLGGGVIILLGIASLLGSGVLALASSIVMTFVLTASFYLFFVDDAIFVLQIWPFRAAFYSAAVVWRNFWASLGFILLVSLILAGTVLVWGFVMQNPLGIAPAILGHAYIATGFTAAGMLFFSQRFAHLQREVSGIQTSFSRE